ncbi:MAG TPA: hypothetical protein VEK76_13100 [Candidatus Binatia bacterium]|nr:hypothetical protein [Candidatus Binatia bacterium]
MAKAQASLAVAVAVFGFDPGPETQAARALHVLTVGRNLPRTELDARESFEAAGARAVEEAGLKLEGGRRARGGRLHLAGIDDASGGRGRSLTLWYYATVPYADVPRPAAWSSVSRGLRLESADAAAFRAGLERLRGDSRHVAGAVGLLGEVFTGDDLFRLYSALHGREGSERTFRRRVQELRDSGVLKPVRDTEVAALRLRVPRFRSPAGTGGRPPELLRYAGTGGEEEQLAVLRARRSA